MKKLIATTIVAAGFALAATPSLAFNLNLVPVSNHVGIGSTVDVGVTVSGLTGPMASGGLAEVVSSFNLTLKFNPAYLSTAADKLSYSLKLGDPTVELFFPGSGIYQSIQGPTTLGANTISFSAASLLPDDPDFTDGTPGLSGLQSSNNLPLDEVLLATIRFTGLDNGGVLLAFDNFDPTTDLTGRSYQGFPAALGAATGTACIMVGNATTCDQGGTVPEPGSAALLLTAIAGLAGVSRRKSLRKSA